MATVALLLLSSACWRPTAKKGFWFTRLDVCGPISNGGGTEKPLSFLDNSRRFDELGGEIFALMRASGGYQFDLNAVRKSQSKCWYS